MDEGKEPHQVHVPDGVEPPDSKQADEVQESLPDSTDQSEDVQKNPVQQPINNPSDEVKQLGNNNEQNKTQQSDANQPQAENESDVRFTYINPRYMVRSLAQILDTEFLNFIIKTNQNDQKLCVLALPPLGPIFSKSAIIQGKAFNLSVVICGSGYNFTLCFCRRHHFRILFDSDADAAFFLNSKKCLEDNLRLIYGFNKKQNRAFRMSCTNVSELIDNFPRLPQYLGDNHTYLVTEKPNFLDVEIEKYSIGKEGHIRAGADDKSKNTSASDKPKPATDLNNSFAPLSENLSMLDIDKDLSDNVVLIPPVDASAPLTMDTEASSKLISVETEKNSDLQEKTAETVQAKETPPKHITVSLLIDPTSQSEVAVEEATSTKNTDTFVEVSLSNQVTQSNIETPASAENTISEGANRNETLDKIVVTSTEPTSEEVQTKEQKDTSDLLTKTENTNIPENVNTQILSTPSTSRGVTDPLWGVVIPEGIESEEFYYRQVQEYYSYERKRHPHVRSIFSTKHIKPIEEIRKEPQPHCSYMSPSTGAIKKLFPPSKVPRKAKHFDESDEPQYAPGEQFDPEDIPYDIEEQVYNDEMKMDYYCHPSILDGDLDSILQEINRQEMLEREKSIQESTDEHIEWLKKNAQTTGKHSLKRCAQFEKIPTVSPSTLTDHQYIQETGSAKKPARQALQEKMHTHSGPQTSSIKDEPKQKKIALPLSASGIQEKHVPMSKEKSNRGEYMKLLPSLSESMQRINKIAEEDCSCIGTEQLHQWSEYNADIAWMLGIKNTSIEETSWDFNEEDSNDSKSPKQLKKVEAPYKIAYPKCIVKSSNSDFVRGSLSTLIDKLDIRNVPQDRDDTHRAIYIPKTTENVTDNSNVTTKDEENQNNMMDQDSASNSIAHDIEMHDEFDELLNEAADFKDMMTTPDDRNTDEVEGACGICLPPDCENTIPINEAPRVKHRKCPVAAAIKEIRQQQISPSPSKKCKRIDSQQFYEKVFPKSITSVRKPEKSMSPIKKMTDETNKPSTIGKKKEQIPNKPVIPITTVEDKEKPSASYEDPANQKMQIRGQSNKVSSVDEASAVLPVSQTITKTYPLTNDTTSVITKNDESQVQENVVTPQQEISCFVNDNSPRQEAGQSAEATKPIAQDGSATEQDNKMDIQPKTLTFMELAYYRSKEFIPHKKVAAVDKSDDYTKKLFEDKQKSSKEAEKQSINDTSGIREANESSNIKESSSTSRRDNVEDDGDIDKAEEQRRIEEILSNNFYKLNDESISTAMPYEMLAESRFTIEAQNFHIPGIEAYEHGFQSTDEYVGDSWGNNANYTYARYCDLTSQELQQQVGNNENVLIFRAEENYGEYLLFENQIMSHVIELYDIEPDMTSIDILYIFKRIHKDPLYISWCDETHCVVVFDDELCASQALKLRFEKMKARPAVRCSVIAALVASRCNLIKAFKRNQEHKLH